MLDFNDEIGGPDTLFAEVILPLAISKRYTYRIPREFNAFVEPGKRAVVQFGKSKLYTAIIASISNTPPQHYEAKYIIDLIDDQPIIGAMQFKLWQWMASYYMCNEGEVMQAALPSALKLASETRIFLLADAEFDRNTLNDKEFLVLEALEIQPELRISDVVKILGQKSVFKIIKGLFDKGIVHISEEVVTKYKPKQKLFYVLNPQYDDDQSRRALFEILERSPKQLDALLVYFKLSRTEKKVSRKDLLEYETVSPAAIKALIEKDILLSESVVVSRLQDGDADAENSFDLSAVQQSALQSIQQHFEQKEVALLHGVTSSGKTQIYVRLIESVVQAGQQVLYLLPEIALTTQVIERLRRYFGPKIGIYHSRLGDNERAEVWAKVLNKEYQIVLGARSSVFLPFSNLGLIVVDEEHESSYKQYDPAPRYHARDTSIFLASLHKAKVLLGSATPSLESYYNAVTGKYGLTEINARFGESSLPDIRIVSISEETSRKTIHEHFTSVLVEAIKLRLERKEQVILFQNRRGYTPLLLCKTCGFSPQCINCDVSLTYHKSSGQLHCHYCGYKQETLTVCPACGSTHIEQKGFGTEKIEDDLVLLFPDARVARMDLDTTRAKNSFQKILNDFDEQRIDILVGTQIVAKGLDFNHVTLIGILNADSMLNYPDFRAFERSFQLLSQVGGRAGRRDKKGEVIIQAHNTSNRVLDQVIHHDYKALFNAEMFERRNFHYPPIFRMIRLDIKHKNAYELHLIADRFGAILRQALGERILGPEEPLISRVRNFYIRTIYIKLEREGISVPRVKAFLESEIIKFESDKDNKRAFIQIDVDPY